jgi:hypothetical protein
MKGGQRSEKEKRAEGREKRDRRQKSKDKRQKTKEKRARRGGASTVGLSPAATMWLLWLIIIPIIL